MKCYNHYEDKLKWIKICTNDTYLWHNGLSMTNKNVDGKNVWNKVGQLGGQIRNKCIICI